MTLDIFYVYIMDAIAIAIDLLLYSNSTIYSEYEHVCLILSIRHRWNFMGR